MSDAIGFASRAEVRQWLHEIGVLQAGQMPTTMPDIMAEMRAVPDVLAGLRLQVATLKRQVEAGKAMRAALDAIMETSMDLGRVRMKVVRAALDYDEVVPGPEE